MISCIFVSFVPCSVEHCSLSPFCLNSLTNTDEESVAMEEVKALSEVVQEVELSIQGADVDAALDSYSLANR